MFDRNKMKDVISKKGIKQKVIAQRAGMTESQLSSILSGRRKCDVEEYVRLCEILEVSFAVFLMVKTNVDSMDSTERSA